jgi:tyrosyl-tRNA synthetase
VGRDIMPGYGLEAQVVMTVPLLEGLDGVEKMSKSLGNYVGVTEGPDEMFGKVMSVSDELMWRYYLLLTDMSEAGVLQLRQAVAAGSVHPKQAKVDLAKLVVSDFHSPAAAAAAAAAFEARFAKGEIAVERLRTVPVAFQEPTMALTRILVAAGLATSTSEGARKVQQGGVRLNRERVIDSRVRLAPGDLPAVLEAGRHAVRLVLG